MFDVTFLGHQGWMFRAGSTCVLADPILGEEFGDVHALGYTIYPPRHIDFDAFPVVDAVILSHEHDDHFDIASLARLDRRIPIYLSEHSSSAAFAILAEMGFAARRLAAGAPLVVGRLEIIPLSGDHVNVNCADEWDALPYLVRDRSGHGSFFTMVDVAIMSQHVGWLRSHDARPGIVTWSNNALDWSCLTDRPGSGEGATAQALQLMGTEHKMIATEWGKPVAMLACAGGFSFHGERAWFNERVFAADIEAVCAKLASMYPGELFANAVPGQTLVMENGRLATVDALQPFLRAAPRGEWPARARRGRGAEAAPDYAPATGAPALDGPQALRLQPALDELAKALVGGILFRSLHSMLRTEAGDRRPTFALVLRDGDRARVFEYDASACTFARSDSDARTTYIAGFECWASDMLAVLEGRLGPLALLFGRARQWNVLPARFMFDLLEGLTRVSHPLTRPREYLGNYRRLWAHAQSIAPAVRARAA